MERLAAMAEPRMVGCRATAGCGWCAASLFLVPSEAGRLFLWALEAAGAEFWGPQTKMSLKRKKHATAIVLVCATLLYSCCANRDYITLTAHLGVPLTIAMAAPLASHRPVARP